MYIHRVPLVICLAIAILALAGCPQSPTEKQPQGNAPPFATPTTEPSPGETAPVVNIPVKPSTMDLEKIPEIVSGDMKLSDADLLSRFTSSDFFMATVTLTHRITQSDLYKNNKEFYEQMAQGQAIDSQSLKMRVVLTAPPSSDQPSGTALQAVISRFVDTDSAKTYIAMFKTPGLVQLEHNGVLFYTTGNNNSPFFLADPVTVVQATSVPLVRQLLNANLTDPSPLAKEMRDLDLNHDGIVIGELSQVRKPLADILRSPAAQQQIPAAVKPGVNVFLANLTQFKITTDYASGGNLVDGILVTKNEQIAPKLQTILTDLVQFAQGLWNAQKVEMQKEVPEDDNPLKELISMVDSLFENYSIKVQGPTILVKVKRPKNFEQLLKILQPFLQRPPQGPPPGVTMPPMTPRPTGDPNATPFTPVQPMPR